MRAASTRGRFPDSRGHSRGRYRARRDVRGHRGTGGRGNERRDVGKIERAVKTERKEMLDGTYGGTGCRPDAGASDLQDDGSHGEAPLVRTEQDGNEGGLRPPGAAS